MGNQLVVSHGNNNHLNSSILGKKAKQALTNITEEIYDNEGNIIKIPVNKWRACCMNTMNKKGSDDLNSFVTARLPYVLNDEECKNTGDCLGDIKVALSIEDEDNYCENLDLDGTKPLPDQGGVPKKNKFLCNKFMVNSCAKSLYEQGCLICTKNDPNDEYCTPQWNSYNKNCFDRKSKELIHGLDECSCINSTFGFSLNTNPSDQVKEVEYPKNEVNPYTIDDFDSSLTDENNRFTKYSLDLFDYPTPYQRPINFDKNCSANVASGGSYQSGSSAPYLLANYVQPTTICLNQIKIGNSKIGEANLKNIQQNNSCGPGSSGYKKSGNQISNTPIKSSSEPTPKTDPKTEPKTDPKTEPKNDPKTEPKNDPEPISKPVIVPKTDPKTDPYPKKIIEKPKISPILLVLLSSIIIIILFLLLLSRK